MKYIYILLVVAFTFTACDPLEDVNQEVDKASAEENIIVGETSFTLTDDDYKTELDRRFTNFNSLDEAKTEIPKLLNKKYPVLGEGSLSNVTFNIYNPYPTESSLIVYTVTTADYDANPDTSRFDNFSSLSHITTFLDTKYPSATSRTLVSLTYKYYDGSTKTLNNGFLKDGDTWKFIQGFTDDEYEVSMQEPFANFSFTDEAIQKIPVYLLEKNKFTTTDEGTILPVMYKLYVTDAQDVDGDGSTTDRTTYSYVLNLVYQQGAWVEYKNITVSSLQFGYEDGTWLPDNTIRYTVTDANSVSIGKEFETATGFEKAAPNLENFKSFERRNTDTEYWSDEMLVTAFDYLLNTIDPDAKDGQKYVLTFTTYIGTVSTEEISLIKAEGKWVLNE